MTTDRRALGNALNRLTFRDRGAVKKESLAAAAAALPEEQAQQVQSAAAHLSAQIHGLGEGTALEVLAAIGMLWSDQGQGR